MYDLPLVSSALKSDLEHFFAEDDLSRNFLYTKSLPNDEVQCSLYFKDDMTISGLPYFVETFNFLGANLNWKDFEKFEGKEVKKEPRESIQFKLPFSIALTGERIALNLLQHASSISTETKKFVEKAKNKNITILDTRKTTPGLRSLEKYAVNIGGGCNHRLGQSDVWMVKDNHKSFFGGLEEAVDFFKSMHGFYTPIEVEIHDLKELGEAIKLNIRHVMLDNFTPEQIKEAVKIKPQGMTFEVSGGVRLHTIDNYLIDGVDAISIGAITYDAPSIDVSLKYQR